MYKHTFYYFLGNKKCPEIYILPSWILTHSLTDPDRLEPKAICSLFQLHFGIGIWSNTICKKSHFSKEPFRVRNLTPPTVAAKAGCLLFQAAAQEKPIHFRRCLCCIFPTVRLCCNFYPLQMVLVLHCNFYPLCACAGTLLHCMLNCTVCKLDIVIKYWFLCCMPSQPAAMI